jgi:hypothetical protein
MVASSAWTLPVAVVGLAAAMTASVAACSLESPAGAWGIDDAAAAASTDASDAPPAAPPALGVTIFDAACDPSKPAVAWSPMRRVSRVEYDNMVRDLLGDTTQPAKAFVPETPMANGVSFETNTYGGVSSLIAQQYMTAAETVAQSAVSDAARLANVILPCSTQDDACAQQFIATFAGRAFRGAIDAAETTALFQLYSTSKATFDFTTGIQAVITAVLESPRFLYVVEQGDGAPGSGVVQLSANEVAGRLALFLWRSVPDAPLMQAAAAGDLATAGGVAAQATRMLADLRARDAVYDFATQWLQLQSTQSLGKDTQFAVWNAHPKLGEEMVDETLLDVSQAILSNGGTLTDLLTSPTSYVNAELASFYGVSLGSGAAASVNDPALDGPSSFVATLLPNRAGVLTNGSVLATQAHTTLPSSVLRGKLVRENVLCDVLHPPPPGIPPPPSSVPDGGTTRSQFEAHESVPGCVSCHQYMDPIGFGFGHFDATGAYQTTDANGQQGGNYPPIDATGKVLAMSQGEFSTTYDGAVDLVTRLSTATQVHQCFALQELRYALGRVEMPSDACSAQSAYAAFAGSDLDIQALLVAIVRSDSFRYRSAANAGSTCQ